MAGATLCVSCAQLPTKDRSLAVNKMRCPDCKSEFGVTSYGATFRFLPPKKARMISPLFMTGIAFGAGFLTFILVLVGLGVWSGNAVTPPRRAAAPPPDELERIREVAFADKFAPTESPQSAKQKLNSVIATIKRMNNENANKDAFVLHNMKQRPELKGLPFVMGTECRLDMQRAQSFQSQVEVIRDSLEQDFNRSHRQQPANAADQDVFWNSYHSRARNGAETAPGVNALTQMLGPERASLRLSLVQNLGRSNTTEATRALARAAIFDTSSDIRTAAVKELKNRPKDAAQDEVLMHGIRYPMSVVAFRAAHAIGALERKDLAPQLAAFLDQAAPGDPEKKVVEDREVCEVREVVKINHHRNCLLCHPPAATGAPNEVPGVMPIPGSPFPSSPREAYGNAQSLGDPMIRADTTYLRQDFSLMMPVSNAAPWPDMQRFDFLVRTRVVEGNELQALLQKVAERPAGFVSENHKAAVDALRTLTGQNAAANRAAWHRIIGVNAND